jgi:hypothetical protein
VRGSTGKRRVDVSGIKDILKVKRKSIQKKKENALSALEKEREKETYQTVALLIRHVGGQASRQRLFEDIHLPRTRGIVHSRRKGDCLGRELWSWSIHRALLSFSFQETMIFEIE